MADYKRKNALRELPAPCNYQVEAGAPMALFLDFPVSDDPERESRRASTET